MAMDDETLIQAVLRVRATQPHFTAAEIHKALVDDGVRDGPNALELSRVKKAASKATKRSAKEAPAAPAPTASAAPEKDGPSKKEAKAMKAMESLMKSSEAHMMEMNRNLRIAMGDDEYSAAVATSDRGENFIKFVTERALEAKLSDADVHAPHARLHADLATLEWMLIAEKASTLTLPEDARESANAQIERLRRIRDSAAFKTEKSWVSECFVLPPGAEEKPLGKPSGIDYAASGSVRADVQKASAASLDRMVAKSGMLSVGGGFDDDID